MREIYFRTCNRHSKVMEYITLQELADEETFDFDFESYDWMQYTGLKDKNGKDIYEGDVVCWITDVVVEQIEEHNRTEPEGLIGSVEFSNGAFFVNSKDEFYSYGEQNFLWSELEIIGNIYENPELLK